MENTRNKIILTGPESTGKTSIAINLSKKFNGHHIAEYARKYIVSLNRDYNYNDILEVARWQRKQYQDIELEAEKPYFIDTYLIITKIWFLWSYNEYPKWIDDSIEATRHCLYLLCAPDIAWQPDEVRENGGENRLRLFDAYELELKNFKLNYKIVRGKDVERNINAATFVEEYWSK